MLKLVIINHTFQKEYFCKRWRMLAEMSDDIDVTLLAPRKFTWGDNKRLTYGNVDICEGRDEENGNFHIRCITMKAHKYRTWTSPDMREAICDIKPDIIYHIGHHQQESLMQVINIRNKYLPTAKLLTFSMRGPTVMAVERSGVSFFRYLLRRLQFEYNMKKTKKALKYSDAIFCHYPDGRDCFVQEGYQGPIYMQTQVGVDMDRFKRDPEARTRIRDRYNLGDAFVFGSATRFTSDKGLSDIIAALPEEGNWKYLMMGSGVPEENAFIERLIKERGFEDRIILTGFIDWYDMPGYWNALDCAVHVPRTTRTWVETFSLSVVQAMATGLPVIANDSGSVPYEIGPEGIIVREGDISAIREKMIWVMQNREQAKKIGECMKLRAENCFSIRHLTECFYDTLRDIADGIHDPAKEDMAEYKVVSEK